MMNTYLTMLVFSACSLFGTAYGELVFTGECQLPVGVSLPLLEKAWGTPLALSNLLFRTTGDPAETPGVHEVFIRPDGLWYCTQHRAEWVDSATNRMILGQVTARYPPELAQTRNDTHLDYIRGSMEAQPQEPADFDKHELLQWMRQFTHRDLKPAESTFVRNEHLAECLLFPSGDDAFFAYAFKYRIADYYPKGWFVLTVASSHPSGLRDDSAVRDDLMNKVGYNTAFQSVPLEQVYSDYYYDPIRAYAFYSVDNLMDWSAVGSQNYALLSNNTWVQGFAEPLIRDLQTARQFFPAVLPEYNVLSNDVAVVHIFNSEEQFATFTGQTKKTMMFPRAHYRPGQMRTPLPPYGSRYAPYLRVSLHELFHHYEYHSFGLPCIWWFSEGFSCYVDYGKVENDQFLITDDTPRFHAIMELVRDSKTDGYIPDLIDPPEKKPKQEAVTDRATRVESERYIVAWGLVYYLKQGVDAGRRPSYARVLDRYMSEARKTLDPLAASRFAFKEVNLPTFISDFNAFWKERAAEKEAKGEKIEPAPDCACELCEEERDFKASGLLVGPSPLSGVATNPAGSAGGPRQHAAQVKKRNVKVSADLKNDQHGAASKKPADQAKAPQSGASLVAIALLVTAVALLQAYASSRSESKSEDNRGGP